MLAKTLKTDIDGYSDDARVHNAIFRGAASGELTRAQVGRYIANIHHLVRHTPICLARAHARAVDRGMTDLARHFEHKLFEETGHDRWAEEDLRRLGEHGHESSELAVPALRDLLDHLMGVIDRDPTVYLSYILFAEYVTVLLGPEWMSLVEQRCGVARESLSVIGNHVELDREHVLHGLAEIDALASDAHLEPMRALLTDTFRYFDQMCAEVVEA